MGTIPYQTTTIILISPHKRIDTYINLFLYMSMPFEVPTTSSRREWREKRGALANFASSQYFSGPQVHTFCTGARLLIFWLSQANSINKPQTTSGVYLSPTAVSIFDLREFFNHLRGGRSRHTKSRVFLVHPTENSTPRKIVGAAESIVASCKSSCSVPTPPHPGEYRD